MPSIDWNKRWGKDLEEFARKNKNKFFGSHWGDPDATGIRRLIQKIRLGDEVPGNLSKVPKKYIYPFVTPESVVLEIGSGGGRWTKYLLTAKEIIVIELNPEFFPYLQERFKEHIEKFRFCEVSGCHLDMVDDSTVDFVFTFGVFPHVEPDGIFSYLNQIKRVLKPAAIAVVQYADMTKKPAQKQRHIFSDMNPDKMEEFVSRCDLKLIRHDTRLLRHSSIAVLQK